MSDNGKIPRRADYRYFGRILTRWGDVDSMGHVNNAKYITYDEQARTDYMLQRQRDAGLVGPHFILARIACDFIEQLHHPAQIDYGMRILRIGRSSLVTQGALFVGDRCHARTEGVIVWFDYETQKPTAVPEAIRAAIRNFEVVQPEE
jgi:acyl-CoA thioester hydrolase